MHIHILGICGTFMGGIAAIAREAGHTVTGCDANVYPPMSTQLEAQGIRLIVETGGTRHLLVGEGNGPIDAAIHALRGAGIDVQVRSFEERAVAPSEDGGNASACAFVELSEVGGQGGERYGVGMDANIVTASIRALLSGVNRLQPAFARAPAARAA